MRCSQSGPCFEMAENRLCAAFSPTPGSLVGGGGDERMHAKVIPSNDVPDAWVSARRQRIILTGWHFQCLSAEPSPADAQAPRASSEFEALCDVQSFQNFQKTQQSCDSPDFTFRTAGISSSQHQSTFLAGL